MVGALLCVVAAEGPILDLSNSAHQRGASTISLPQPPDDTPIRSAGNSRPARRLHCASCLEEAARRPTPCDHAPVREPPGVIDGARVLKLAEVAAAKRTGNTRHIIGGGVRTTFSALLVAQYPADDGYYLLYCDEDWNAVTDTFHLDLDSALSQAAFEYRGVSFRDV